MSHASFDSLEEKLAQLSAKFGSAEINAQRSSSSSPTPPLQSSSSSSLSSSSSSPPPPPKPANLKAQFDEEVGAGTLNTSTELASALALSSLKAPRVDGPSEQEEGEEDERDVELDLESLSVDADDDGNRQGNPVLVEPNRRQRSRRHSQSKKGIYERGIAKRREFEQWREAAQREKKMLEDAALEEAQIIAHNLRAQALRRAGMQESKVFHGGEFFDKNQSWALAMENLRKEAQRASEEERMKDCDFDKFHRGRVFDSDAFDARNRTWVKMKQRRQRKLKKETEEKFAEEHTFQPNASSLGSTRRARRNMRAQASRSRHLQRRRRTRAEEAAVKEKENKNKNKKKGVVVEQAAVRRPERDSLVEPGLRQLLDAMDAALAGAEACWADCGSCSAALQASITDLLEEAARVPQEVMN